MASKFRLAKRCTASALLGFFATVATAQYGQPPAPREPVPAPASPSTPAGAPAPAQEGARPEVAKPLQAAQELLKVGKHADALTKLREAEAIGNLTPYELYIVQRMTGVAANGVGDTALAIKSFAAVIDSGRLPAEEKLPMMEALAGLAFKAKDYPESIRWSQRFLAEGGKSDSVQTMLLSAQFLSNDCAGVTKTLTAAVQEDAAAKRPTSETHWKMLAQCQRTLGDNAGYVRTLERWVVQYPKKEIWADLIGRAASHPGFAERLQLDLYRLMRATGTLDRAEQFEHMAQLSLDAGYPAEARQVLDDGFTRERLGSGPNAQRHNRMRRTAEQKAASDTVGALEAMVPNVQTSVGLINIGYAMTTLGQIDKGVKLMRQGIAKGSLKHPEDARLRLGAVLAQAGRTEEAREVLSSVTGKDGTGDLARLWLAFADSGAGKGRK